MNIWLKKMKALLHDPIHKQWVMWTEAGKSLKLNAKRAIHIDKTDHSWHEIVAEELLNSIFHNECVKDDEIERVDKLASAMSRIIVAPNLSEEERKKYEEDSSVKDIKEIKFIDTFSLKEKEIEMVFNHNDIKMFFEKLGDLNFKNKEEREQLIFLFLWRFLPMKFPWVLTHPADSRAPNHSIYDHLVQTSAIIPALPNPAFLLFTIGPVQEFISNARKTQDLWAGSYLLSYLTWKAIENIIDKFGPDSIIFPNLLEQPFCDRWLFKKFENSPLNSKFSNLINKLRDSFKNYEKITIANLPNRFLAIIPNKKNIAENCQKTIEKELEELARKIWEKVKNFANNSSLIKNYIREHLTNYFQIYWIILPWTKESIYDCDTILSEYENFVGKTEAYKIVRIITDHSFYKPSTVGNAYSLFIELAEKFLGSRKMIRNFQQISEQKGKYKCSLCGEMDEISSGIKDFWEKFRKENPGLIRDREKLCGVCLAKRLLPRIFGEELNVSLGFPSTSEIASIG